MQESKINHAIVKNIGYVNYGTDFIKNINDNHFVEKFFDKDTHNFLHNSYHTEYVNIMFPVGNKQGVKRFVKDLNYDIEICSIQTKVSLNYIELFLFNDSYKSSQTGIFSLDFFKDNITLNDISNISFCLKSHDCEILYLNQKMFLKDFVSKHLLFGVNFHNDNSSLQQYAGSKFKQYLVVDFDHDINDRDNLLFELGTSSKIGTVENNSLESPSLNYLNKILVNKISCFKNYECLTLLNSFTVIGNNNYDRNHIHTHASWNDIYFSIYIYGLYMKSTLQVLSNDFSTDSMQKRYEFQNFYNKYFRKKISYNFLPNEIYDGIIKSLEIDQDLDYVQEKLETLAVQVNERQQNQLGYLLACISVIALLETPLHIEGIRDIIGIENMIVYNSITYFVLILIVILFMISKTRKKY